MADENDRPATALIDYIAIAFSPLLIMLMVGSLVFFLIEVLYQGNYSDRVLYTMFFFVIGAVLIARIAIEHGTGRAMLYVLGLGVATFIAMQAYVDYPTRAMRAIGPMINLGLMVLIWWSANKLTWDCTHLDGEREAGGRGLLAATGIQESAIPEPDTDEESPKKKKKQSPGLLGWVQRYSEYREAQKKKPHTPGTWVIYFGLAAIPLFILGQSLIPADDAARRRATFLQMAAFVGSGLGLLVTTSLLGLKKYLQDRGARIPGAMTASWLGLGAVLIIGFLVFGALLPRPHSETALITLPKSAKSERKASKFAPYKGQDAGTGEGAKGNKTEAGDGKANAKGGQPGGKGEKGDAKSGSGSKDGKNASGGGQQKGEQGGGKGDQKGNSSSDNSSKSNSKGDNAKNDSSKSGDSSKGENKANSSDSKQEGSQAQDADNESSDGNREGGSSSFEGLTNALESVSGWVKWLAWIIVAILVVVGVIIFFLKFLAPFTAWARGLLDWFRNLFKPKARTAAAGTDVESEPTAGESLPPFDSFDNPFADGTHQRKPVDQLVRYTFTALESWAADRDLARRPGETPREFTDRLSSEFPQFESAAKLATLVVRVAYSNRELPNTATATLQQTWVEMERLAPVPAS